MRHTLFGIRHRTPSWRATLALLGGVWAVVCGGGPAALQAQVAEPGQLSLYRPGSFLVLVKGADYSARLYSDEQMQLSIRYNNSKQSGLTLSTAEAGKLDPVAFDCPLALVLEQVSLGKGQAMLEAVGVKSTRLFFQDLEYRLGNQAKHPVLVEMNALAKDYENLAMQFYQASVPTRDLKGLIEKNLQLRIFIETRSKEVADSNTTALTARFYSRLEEEAAQAFETMSVQQPQQQEIRDSATLEEKAIYERNDNYSPAVYEDIYNWRRSCVAIVPPNQQAPIGSGVLISNDVVLTCKHVVAGLAGIDAVKKEGGYTNPSTARWHVWIDHEMPRPGQTHNPIKCRVEGYIALGRKVDGKTAPLDFALLKIKPADVAMPGPLPLTLASPVRWDPLVVIGFPQRQTQWVHDNSWVILPYLRDVADLPTLRQQIINDFLDEPPVPGAKPGTKPTAEKSAEDFITKHYLPHPEYPDSRLFIDSWMENGLEIRVHAIAVESDTFRGNSGSPAINRVTGNVVGILQRGQPDGNVRVDSTERKPDTYYKPGATIHEALLPIDVIARQLDEDADKPDGLKWRALPGIKLVSP